MRKKLIQLFKLNEKNLGLKNTHLITIITDFDLIKNVYYKLKFTNEKKVKYKIDWKILKNLSEQIKKKSYVWNSNQFLWNKKIDSFKDNLVKKLLEIILNIIYEPIFQTLEYNYGFRINRTIQKVIRSLKLHGSKWKYVLKSEVTTGFKNINFKILTRSLKKKIQDSDFSKLLQNLLKSKVSFNNNSIYFILHNIYIHEFDLFISKKIKALKRKFIQIKLNNFQWYLKHIIKKPSIFLKVKLNKFSIKIFWKWKSFIKKKQKKKLNFKIQFSQYKKTQTIYNRYNNFWVFFTNYDVYKIKNLKNKLIWWFQKNLKFNFVKVLIINLIKNKLNYLGFTLCMISFKIKKIYYKNKIEAKRKKKATLLVGIDHRYLKNKFVEGSFLRYNYRPSHISIYPNLILIQVLKKFKKKLITLKNYYYNTINYPTDLNYYYYVYRFLFWKAYSYRK